MSFVGYLLVQFYVTSNCNVFETAWMCSDVFECVRIRIRMRSNTFKCVRMCSNLLKCYQMCPNMFEWFECSNGTNGSNGSNVRKCFQMFSKVFAYIQICSNVLHWPTCDLSILNSTQKLLITTPIYITYIFSHTSQLNFIIINSSRNNV